jgi:pimeloyl-ACP methyl ester carboxylesterase
MKTPLAAAIVVAAFTMSIRAQQLPPPPGKLVDVGGHRLHVNCTGTGSPTVILESGASSFAIDWALVQPAVARTNRVCSYDRAGYGWSEPAAYDMRGEDAIRSLHKALDVLGERPPFVLVGHSMGGRYVRLFQLAYRSEVKAMVLVDAEHEDGLYIGVSGRPVPISSLSDDEFDAAWKPPSGPPPAVPEQQLQPAHLKLPPPLQPIRLQLQQRFFGALYSATPDAMRQTMRSEHTALRTLHQLSATEEHPLHDLPLIVLTRGLDESPARLRSQQALVQLSSKGKQIVVDDSDHEIQLFRPDMVIQAIADVSK